MKFNPHNRIRLVLSFFLLAALLSACGQNQETASPTAPSGTTTPTASSTVAASPSVGITPTTAPVSGGMPFLRPYPNGTAYDMGKEFDEALRSREAALLGNEIASHISSQKYFTPDTSTQIIAYYEPILFQLGYQKIGRVDISLLTVGTASTFAVLFANGTTPDSDAILVATVGPLSEKDQPQLKPYNPEVASQIKVLDTLINVFSGFTYGQVPAQIIIPDATLTGTRPNVPLYATLSPLELGPGFFDTITQALVGLVGQEASVNAKLNFYRMPGLPDDFYSFYDAQMPTLNYRRVGIVDTGSIAAIGKVKSQAVLYEKTDASRTGTIVIALGPWSDADYTLLTKIVLLAKNNFKAGDSIVIIITNLPLSGLSNGLVKGK